jgi:hypothetical protein
MFSRWLMLSLLGCLLAVAAPVLARQTLMGNIDSVTTGSITVKATDGEMQTYKVEATARITLDGKRATLDDLKTGDAVMVTTQKQRDVIVATAIAARTKA